MHVCSGGQGGSQFEESKGTQLEPSLPVIQASPELHLGLHFVGSVEKQSPSKHDCP